ncbi:Signal recognition particle, SRP9 subunit,Signal recognition particle, SRP9/SRP14 subunit [Cinara cedri]|uniref:Signal recognition particle 9 kDa protein n=1 Tax=Cinara cedri TaxID=506608 RepID=A0A5E4N8Q3_9HEMI|nr:Signal recognition particle, SRP9 subunit,Signal recognition particle, SRP9/SRP14 subunit [Cinara cedri]
MYLKTWKEFETASFNLLLRDPTRVRCTMKYCHSQGTVVLKVTDNISCLQFKTSDIQSVKKIEAFYATIMKQIISVDVEV